MDLINYTILFQIIVVLDLAIVGFQGGEINVSRLIGPVNRSLIKDELDKNMELHYKFAEGELPLICAPEDEFNLFLFEKFLDNIDQDFKYEFELREAYMLPVMHVGLVFSIVILVCAIYLAGYSINPYCPSVLVALILVCAVYLVFVIGLRVIATIRISKELKGNIAPLRMILALFTVLIAFCSIPLFLGDQAFDSLLHPLDENEIFRRGTALGLVLVALLPNAFYLFELLRSKGLLGERIEDVKLFQDAYLKVENEESNATVRSLLEMVKPTYDRRKEKVHAPWIIFGIIQFILVVPTKATFNFSLWWLLVSGLLMIVMVGTGLYLYNKHKDFRRLEEAIARVRILWWIENNDE